MTPEQFKEIQERIDWLESNGRYLEIVSLSSAMIEDVLINLIESHESWTKKLLRCKRIDFKIRDYRINKFSRGMTLGQKSDYLKIFISNNELFRDLEKFTKLRNKVIHKILKTNIKELEKEIKSNMRLFYKIFCTLAEEQLRVIKKELGKSKRLLTKKKKLSIKNTI